jgi:murein L,D-transpeptidase YcbB/YkuD
MTVLLASFGAPVKGSAQPPGFASALDAQLERRATAAQLGAHILRDVAALHGDRPPRALWTDESGRPIAEARSALEIIAFASDDGLDPDDYALASLSAGIDALVAAPAPAPEQVASFEIALSTAIVTLFHHLHFGRVEPRHVDFRLGPTREGHDIAAMIRDAIAHRRLADAAAALRPPLAQYARLRAALALYRRHTAHRSFDTALPAAVVRPGDRYAGLAGLAQRLTVLGDLPSRPTDAPAFETYDVEVVEAVRRFQRRHGLAPDGIVGPATLAALNVPLPDRVRQIELALERLRWLPDLDGRLLTINIPMFHLWGWSSVENDRVPAIDMKVIVGRALKTRTPVFTASLERVIFRPFWNVPTSITRGEILPRLARDPGYLERERLELVRGPGDDARVVAASSANLAALKSGGLRLRQRQGPENSLGLVKFDFPNASDVYLHGTPARQLFERPRRDFSHGCVRVEDPERLAAWVLAPLGSWPSDRIVAAMHASGPPLEVTLPEPITVVLFYTTAIAASDGTIRFAADIYGHDAALARALRSERMVSSVGDRRFRTLRPGTGKGSEE